MDIQITIPATSNILARVCHCRQKKKKPVTLLRPVSSVIRYFENYFSKACFNIISHLHKILLNGLFSDVSNQILYQFLTFFVHDMRIIHLIFIL